MNLLIKTSQSSARMSNLEQAVRLLSDNIYSEVQKMLLNEQTEEETTKRCKALQIQLQSLGYQFRLESAETVQRFALHVERLANRQPLSPFVAFCDFCNQPAVISSRLHQLCREHARKEAPVG